MTDGTDIEKKLNIQSSLFIARKINKGKYRLFRNKQQTQKKP